MKKIFSLNIIILLSVGVYAQPGYLPRQTKEKLIATIADSGLHVPAFERPRYPGVIAARAGSLLIDSVGGGRGLYYSPGGNVLIRLRDTTEVGGNTSNGVRAVGDTIQLGGSIDKATHIQLSNQQTAGSLYTYLHLANRPSAEALIQEVSEYPTVSIYNPTTLAAEGLYEESENDTAYLHYGGRFVSVVRNVFDSTSTRFAASNKYILLPSNGFEGVYQFMIPRDTTVWRVGRDGQSANVMHSQWDLGDTYGYNTHIVPETGIPGFPLTTNLSSIDLMRNIDVTRSHKMSGAGVSGFTSRYKTYQSAINMSTYEAGNYTDSIFGYTAYGDIYPQVSGATKAKTLAVWDVKNAYGFYAHPQYRYTNTVRNGYGFYAAGDSDQNRFNFVRIGGAANNFLHQLEVTGDVMATDSVHGFIVDGYALSAKIPVAIGTEANVVFGATDSVQAASIGMQLPANRDARHLAIRVEGFNAATYPDNSNGMYIRFETGGNHANVSRINRNGNWTFGNTAAALNYKNYKKGAFAGGTAFLDTMTYINTPIAPYDTTNYKPIWQNTANGDLYRGYHSGSGGGGGSGTVNSGTANRLTYYASTGTAVSELAAITANRALISDANGLPTHATTTATEIGYVNGVTSAIQTQIDGKWSLAGNSATAGSQTGSFFGTTNSVALRFRTNNTQRMYLDSARAQLVIGAPTINANDALIIQGISGSGNYDGITMYPNNLSTKMTYGFAGIQRAGGIDINTSSGSISLSPNTGVIIGTSFGTATSLLHINGSTTSKSQLRLISTGALPTAGNILAGNVDAIGDKIYYTISTGPAQKEFTLNDAALTSGTTPVATTNGRLTNGLILAAAEYTPTMTDGTNTTGVTILEAQYIREGDYVVVYGIANAPVTAGSTLSTFEVSLPIASNFGVTTHLTGSGSALGTGSQNAVFCLANSTNDRAIVQFYTSGTGDHNVAFNFSYKIR